MRSIGRSSTASLFVRRCVSTSSPSSLESRDCDGQHSRSIYEDSILLLIHFDEGGEGFRRILVERRRSGAVVRRHRLISTTRQSMRNLLRGSEQLKSSTPSIDFIVSSRSERSGQDFRASVRPRFPAQPRSPSATIHCNRGAPARARPISF